MTCSAVNLQDFEILKQNINETSKAKTKRTRELTKEKAGFDKTGSIRRQEMTIFMDLQYKDKSVHKNRV